MALAPASPSRSKSESVCLSVVGLGLRVIGSDSGMTAFGFSVGAVSVGEHCEFNSKIHTWLKDHNLAVREL